VNKRQWIGFATIVLSLLAVMLVSQIERTTYLRILALVLLLTFGAIIRVYSKER
jgi:hypothetical protein